MREFWSFAKIRHQPYPSKSTRRVWLTIEQWTNIARANSFSRIRPLRLSPSVNDPIGLWTNGSTVEKQKWPMMAKNLEPRSVDNKTVRGGRRCLTDARVACCERFLSIRSWTAAFRGKRRWPSRGNLLSAVACRQQQMVRSCFLANLHARKRLPRAVVTSCLQASLCLCLGNRFSY